MKSIPKGKFAIILILFTLTFILSMNNSLYFIKNNKNFKDDNKNSFLDENNIKISNSLGRIYINNNWSEAKNAGICSGEGTYSNPYVIEDLVINGGETDRGIYITNSSDYFKIDNCTIFDCIVGITLSNVNNSQLINNKIFNNSFGVSLIYCYKNNITLNNIFNSFEGLILYYCYHNNFSGNNIHNNHRGLYLINCYNNNILNNNISQNFRLFVNSPIIGANTTSGRGIDLMNSSSNFISENVVNNNYDVGIILSFSNDNTIAKNTINNNRRGIWLSYNCTNNIISRNKLFGNDECIVEENCTGNRFENNNCGNESILGYYPFLIINGAIVITIILGKKLKKKL